MYRNFVRITGGTHRGLRLRVVSGTYLRPTAERVRESVFAQLGAAVRTQVLDLFAGSGVLGFEALSRGASGAVFVDSSSEACLQLQKSAEKFAGTRHRIIHCEALAFLHECHSNFGMVFLDPPYKSQLLNQALKLLLECRLLRSDALIYAESPQNHKIVAPGFISQQETSYGRVKVTLLRISPWAAAQQLLLNAK